MIQLGEEQLAALDMTKEVIKNKSSTACAICGPAGVGKTECLRTLIGWLEENYYNYCLCAPTHKAALVMQRATDRDAITLHKLLALSPDLNIFDLDFNNLLFKVSNKHGIPYKGVVIVDEASMINDDLYDLLCTKCSENQTTIVFIFDPKQIQPVKMSRFSKVVDVSPMTKLTKIYRQSSENGLLPVLAELRLKPKWKFNNSIGTDGKLVVTSDIRQFLEVAKRQFLRGITNKDILETKIIAYTNERVYSYNRKMHEFLCADGKEYFNGEILTCYENLEFNNFKFFNSMDYVIIDEPKEIDISIPNCGTFPGYELVLYDSLTLFDERIKILSRDTSKETIEFIACLIDTYRQQAVEKGARSRFAAKPYWEQYYKMINSFTTPFDMYYDNRLIRKKSFDYGYAITAHKSQGSNLNNVLVDIKNINICQDVEQRRQLQYVALSRTRKNALILQ